jgi:hypothetical protein
MQLIKATLRPIRFATILNPIKLLMLAYRVPVKGAIKWVAT